MKTVDTYSITTTGHKADGSGNELRDEQGLAHKPKYYSVYDRDTSNFLATGRNSESLDDIADSMWSYMQQDLEEENKKAFTAEEIVEELNFYNFEVVGHDEKMEEEM